MIKKNLKVTAIILMSILLVACGKDKSADTANAQPAEQIADTVEVAEEAATDEVIEDEVAEAESEMPEVTIENIIEANKYTNVMKSHDKMYYSTEIYANEDVDNGYLGYDELYVINSDDGIAMITSGACQSEDVKQAIYKDENGKWIKKWEAAGEGETTEYNSEAEAMEAIASYELLSRENVESEEVVETSSQDGALVVETKVNSKSDGEYTAIYWLNPETLELYAINKTIHTESDYGNVLYTTSFVYDTKPDFEIHFMETYSYDEALKTVDNEIFMTDEYMDLATLLAMINDGDDEAIDYNKTYSEIYAASLTTMPYDEMIIGWAELLKKENPNIATDMLDKYEKVWNKTLEKYPELDTDVNYSMLSARIFDGFRAVEGKWDIGRLEPNKFFE